MFVINRVGALPGGVIREKSLRLQVGYPGSQSCTAGTGFASVDTAVGKHIESAVRIYRETAVKLSNFSLIDASTGSSCSSGVLA